MVTLSIAKPLSVFISFSSVDRSFAKRLYTDLSRFGIGAWLDSVELLPGDSLKQELSVAIDRTDVLCVVLSPDSIKSKWVEWETNRAIEKQKQIIPIFYRDCQLSEAIEGIIYIDFRSSFHKGFSDLVRTLNPVEKDEEPNLQRQLCIFMIRSAVGFEQAGDIAQAESYYRAAIDTDSSYAEAYYDFGVFLYGCERIELAVAMFEKTLDCESNHLKAMFNLGSIALRDQDLKRAEIWFQQALDVGHDVYVIYRQLGLVQLATGRSNIATTNFIKALLGTSDQKEHAAILGFLYESVSQHDPKGCEIAYLEEHVLVTERFQKPVLPHYITLIKFFSDNTMILKAKEYYSRLFSLYPEEKELAQELSNYIEDMSLRAEEMKRQYEAKEIYTNYRQNYESSKANLYNEIGGHFGMATGTLYKDGGSFIQVPKRFD